ncbi:hypothetical protein D3C72_1218590 [compost metagenome]
MQDIDARLHLEQFAGHVDGRAAARRGESQLAGILLGVFHQFLNRLDRHLGIHDQDVRHLGAQGDRREILGEIERDVLVERLVDGAGDGHEQQRVAVRRGALHVVGGNVAAGARLVFNHERLAQGLGEFLGHDAGDHVGSTASRKTDHDTDGFVRVCSMGGTHGECASGGGQNGGGETPQARLLTCSHSVSVQVLSIRWTIRIIG